MFKNLVATLVVVVTSANFAYASKPPSERSLDRCQYLLGQGFEPSISTSHLISVGQLLAASKNPYLARLHVMGEVHNREYPTPGLKQMFLTASTAADSLIRHLDEKAVRPRYKAGDMFSAAAETEALMLDPKKQPKYIREAVLIREGVVVVVPILERIRGGDKPVYIPIIVKGHQDLEISDKLTAAFAAWALGASLGRIPDEAWIYRKPMADKRALDQEDTMSRRKAVKYKLVVEDFLPHVEMIHADYVEVISDRNMLDALQPWRDTAAMQSHWGSYIRELAAQEMSLSMMPYPPSPEQAIKLARNGFPTMKELAKLDINSDKFFFVSVSTGIKPDRLRRFVAQAISSTTDRPVLLEEYEDPFEGVKYASHVDFEDLMSRALRSGVYLFGQMLEDLTKGDGEIVDERFAFADNLSIEGVADAWAEFIRYHKKSRRIRGGNYLMTVYSHHEVTKFKQEFNIVKARLEDFTRSERRSKYFRASKDGRHGFYIKNKAFFRTYKDISPADVFDIMEREVDLFYFIRRYFAFPTYSRGLKHILPYVIEAGEWEVEFPEGWNGLESIEWAKNAYETLEQPLFDQIEDYNRIDVEGNRVVAWFVRSMASASVPANLHWSQKNLEVLDDVTAAAQTRSAVDYLFERYELLTGILGKPLKSLKKADVQELLEILDRTEYLARRAAISDNPRLEPSERNYMLQQLLNEFRDARLGQLLDFFERVGGFDRHTANGDLIDKMAGLFLHHRLDAYTQKSFNQMILLERLIPLADKNYVKVSQPSYKRVRVPNRWLEKMEELMDEDIAKGLDLDRSDIREMWLGLYYQRAFESEDRRIGSK